MSVEQAYNSWAEQYDTNINKTRDVEATSLREMLASIEFEECLEIGCGTGKNTGWLITKAKHITAIDLSEEMLAKAKEKIKDSNVEFIQADITKDWTFVKKQYDLVTFSLVLEHIKDLETIFKKVAASLKQGGYVYAGELHPFKQYSGSKARFETSEGLHVVDCYNHHVSDLYRRRSKAGLQ
jgi:ubiquinone/menaquinone biosynthesis C-methylase UbiE